MPRLSCVTFSCGSHLFGTLLTRLKGLTWLGARLVLSVLVFCHIQAFAEDAPKTSDSAGSEHSETTPPKVSDYVGSRLERFALGWQYQYQYAEQPSNVLVTQPGNKQLLLPNPEHNLNQHSLTYDFGQVILTPAQLARVKKLDADVCLHGDKQDNFATCVAEAGGGAKRFLSGLKVTATIAEHPVAAQGSILPAGYLFGGEVDFSPANLFTAGTDWKTITTGISDSDKRSLQSALKGCDEPPDPRGKEADRINDVKCAKEGLLAFRGPTRKTKWEAVLYSMAPTFQYKRLTPFDFLKYGGTLIPSSNSGGLNSWSLTVDARRLVASATSRLDAIDASQAIRNTKSEAVVSTKLCGLIFTRESVSLISVPSDTSKESCVETAKAIKAVRYELACSGDQGVLVGPPEVAELPVPASALPATITCWK